jgi:hypothetical protein
MLCVCCWVEKNIIFLLFLKKRTEIEIMLLLTTGKNKKRQKKNTQHHWCLWWWSTSTYKRKTSKQINNFCCCPSLNFIFLWKYIKEILRISFFCCSYLKTTEEKKFLTKTKHHQQNHSWCSSWIIYE